MRLPKFECLEPRTVQEACSLLSQYKEKARVIAGGTDLLVKMKNREIRPQYLISFRNISHLNYIEHEEAEGLRIGTLATLNALETSTLVQGKSGVLAQAIRQMASPPIRSLATIGGNLCNAVPSADTAPPLIVMGAKLKLVSPNGERIILLQEFFTGPEETILGDGEILEEIRVPNPLPHSGGVYIKLMMRRALDLAIVGVAAMITRDPAKGVCQDIRIALGAVAPTPIRAREAESILKGKSLEDKLIAQAGQAAANEAHPISDIRSSAEYRREMVGVLTRRVVSQAWEKAKSANP